VSTTSTRLPVLVQRGHDDDAHAAVERGCSRTGAATLALRTSALRLCKPSDALGVTDSLAQRTLPRSPRQAP
jgi:hypothetical protein